MKKTTLLITGLIVLIVAAVMITGLSKQKPNKPVTSSLPGPVYSTGAYQLRILLDPERPAVGNNQLTLSIQDIDNHPVTDARIKAYVEMPAMGSMPAMREPLTFESAGAGIYLGRYKLPMNGPWPLTIHIDANSQNPAELSFDMSTSRTGLKLASATPSPMTSNAQQPPAVKQTEAKQFTVDDRRRQLIGVTTARVICKPLLKTIHANARVDYDHTRFVDITLKYAAWIGRLDADFVGKPVHKGDTLFTVYSPELVSAQDEYLHSLRRQDSGRYALQDAAHQRLAQWDIDAAQIRALAKRGRANQYLSITAPIDGTVIEKNIVRGSAVKAGARLLRLADLSTVWVDAEVYESDLPWIETGQHTEMTFPDIPGQSHTGTVSYISPMLQQQTRTAIVRVQLDNPKGGLRPGMFVRMNLQIDLGRRLVVPEQAVIYAGNKRIVFVDLGDGRLQPRIIKTGLRNENDIEVVDGLNFGDSIVTSGNFLIAAESKMKAGLAQW